MTDRSIIGKEQVGASGRTAPGSATKATRHAGARHKSISAEERERLIAIEAYYRAERRGFAPGGELRDWCEAEAEIERRLGRA